MKHSPKAITVDSICQALAELAPLALAEAWDNVGLLVGDRSVAAERVMTCLTISPPVVAEALQRRVDLIVTHHPLPFQPLKRLTTDSVTGRMLWELIGQQVAIYSAHTAFDSAVQGINQQWAELLELSSIAPLTAIEPPIVDEPSGQTLGSGRFGTLATPLSLHELAGLAQQKVAGRSVRVVGASQARIARVGIACGSGGSFLAAAKRRGCQALITGEANFHGCLEAEASGIGLVLVGHYASERFAMEGLAEWLGGLFPQLEVWASVDEADPLWSAN
ncbi:Nif3-like dinuclear metal center hexameric protein [Planctomycetaceae bacterium SH139]